MAPSIIGRSACHSGTAALPTGELAQKTALYSPEHTLTGQYSRYFLPLVLLLPFMPYPSNPSLTPAPTTLNPPLILSTQPYTTSANPATSQTLLRALADLHAINGLVPTFEARNQWIEWVKMMGRKRLLRALGVIWTAWILVNAVLGARATLAIIGTILLLLPSPFLANMSELLHRSLLIRRLSAFAFLFIFGSTGTEPDVPLKTDERDALPAEPFSVRAWLRGKWTASKRPSFAFRARPVRPPLVTSASLTGSALDTTPPPSPPLKPTDPSLQPSAPLYFRFELQENQRWWMGLDWTSALLPQERAAWCDVYLNPTSPPQGFTLPSETTIYLPEPRKGDPAGRARRTARWRWVDEEWIVVRKLGQGKIGAGLSAATPVADRPSHASASSIAGAVSPVITPATPEEPKKGIAEQAFVKGLERLKARTMAGGVGLPTGLAGVVGAAGAKVRPLSGDYSNSGSPGTSPEVGRRMSEDNKRKSSGASGDLVHTALNNATTMQANGIGLGILGDSASASAGAPMPMPSADLDAGTDMDGWSYGDNKWEGMGPKGGLGKVSRLRHIHKTGLMWCTVYAQKAMAASCNLYRGNRVHSRRETCCTDTIIGGQIHGYRQAREGYRDRQGPLSRRCFCFYTLERGAPFGLAHLIAFSCASFTRATPALGIRQSSRTR